MTDKTIASSLALAMGVVGISIVLASAGFWAAAGVFLFVWSNNLSHEARKLK